MKKGFVILLSSISVVMLIYVLALSADVSTVSALTLPTSISISGSGADDAPANGEWEYENVESSMKIPGNDIMVPAPHPWLVPLGNGLHIETTAPVEICHPFRGGQFGWTAKIFLQNGSTWLEIPSITAWTPDEEGRLMICATAPMSGNYVIFGYSEPYEHEEEEIGETQKPLLDNQFVGFTLSINPIME